MKDDLEMLAITQADRSLVSSLKRPDGNDRHRPYGLSPIPVDRLHRDPNPLSERWYPCQRRVVATLRPPFRCQGESIGGLGIETKTLATLLSGL